MPKSCAVLLRDVAMLLDFQFSSGMSKTEQTSCFRRCNPVVVCECVSVPERNIEEELSNGIPDILLSDLNMPGMSGFDCSR
jgi:CheY-like chemotaxis protein